ncbi:hypothetical protein AcW1_002893 [Taiwanofungus camphoratus]|nr:hypothetical protein AcW1_002893 [Antrodia cinnamomea]
MAQRSSHRCSHTPGFEFTVCASCWLHCLAQHLQRALNIFAFAAALLQINARPPDRANVLSYAYIASRQGTHPVLHIYAPDVSVASPLRAMAHVARMACRVAFDPRSVRAGQTVPGIGICLQAARARSPCSLSSAPGDLEPCARPLQPSYACRFDSPLGTNLGYMREISLQPATTLPKPHALDTRLCGPR